MATTKLYLDTRRVKNDGTCPLKLALADAKGTAYISLHTDLRPENWDKRAGKVVGRSDRQFLNTLISQRKQEIDNILLTLTYTHEANKMNIVQLRERIEQELLPEEERKKDTTHLFACNFLKSANQRKGRTREAYMGTYKHLQRFVGRTFDDLTFDDVNKDFLIRFDNYLAQTSPSRNARNIHLRNIRAVFNDAIDNDITTKYPFRKFIIKSEETAHRALTVEELRQLFTYPCEEWQQQYMDMFKLIFYLCGINIIDLFNLRTIVKGRIEYHRAKTKKFYSIKVEPEAQAIIDKYKGKTALLDIADRYTNYMDYAKRLNRTIQHLGQYERKGRGGKKIYTPLFPDITTYWMRHTWATLAHEIGIPRDTIALALGHSWGNPVTAIYIKPDLRLVDEANRRVLDYVLYDKK